MQDSIGNEIKADDFVSVAYRGAQMVGQVVFVRDDNCFVDDMPGQKAFKGIKAFEQKALLNLSALGYTYAMPEPEDNEEGDDQGTPATEMPF